MKMPKFVRGKTPPGRVIFRKKTPYQEIAMRRTGGGVLFTLNESWQVHTVDERRSHECVAMLPMMLARKVDDVLILGGGDGLAAREALRFSGAKRITLVELDGTVIDVCSTHAEWRKITGDSLLNPRVRVVVGDAIKFLVESRRKYDVILHDIEISDTDQPTELTLELYERFFRAMQSRLKPGGVACVYMDRHDDIDDAQVDALFSAMRENLPRRTQTAFLKQRVSSGKAKVLFKVLFPHVLQWTVQHKIMGDDTAFYLSNEPMTKLRRFPQPEPAYFSAKVFKKIRQG